MALSRFVNRHDPTGGLGVQRGLSRMTGQNPQQYPDYTQRISNAERRLMAVGQEIPQEPDQRTILDRIFGVLNYLNNKKNQGLAYITGDEQAFERDNISGADLLRQWGMQEGTGNQIAGFAFDVVTDPLNFLTFGTAGVAAQAAKGGLRGAKALRGLDDVARPLGGTAARSTTKAIEPSALKQAEDAVNLSEEQRRWFAQLGAFGHYWKIPGSDRVLHGIGDAVGGAFKGLGRFIERHSPELAQAGRDIKDTLGRLFSRGYGLPGSVNQATQRAQDLFRMDIHDIVSEVTEIVGNWKNVDHMNVISAVENPANFSKLNPEEIKAFNQVKDFFDKNFLKAMEYGVIEEFRANYIPHIFKGKLDEVSAALEQIRRRGARVPTNSPFGKERTILMDLSEIMSDPELVAKLRPETDLAKIMGIYKLSLQKAIRNREMIDELVGLGPDIIRRVGEEYIPDGWVKAPVQQLKGYAVPPDVARHLKDIMEPFINSDTSSKLFRLYDQMLGWWKGMATIPNPGFHLRNIMGNVFNNYLAGVRSIKPYNLALKALKEQDHRLDDFYDLIRTGDFDLSPVPLGVSLDTPGVGVDPLRVQMQRILNEPKFREAITGGSGPKIKIRYGDEHIDVNLAGIKLLARMNGITGRGMIGADIGGELEKVLRQLRSQRSIQDFNPLSRESYIFRGLESFGQGAEDHARLAHFIDRLQKGDTIEEAALSVKKYLFDYSHLTPFEKNVMKRFIPFYAWTRFNMPLQFIELAKQPKYATLMGKFQNFMEALSEEVTGTEMDKDDMPRYLRDLYAVRLPFQVGADNRDVIAGIDLPIRDVNSIRPSEWFSMMTPFLTVPFEQVANRNVYFGRDIESYEGQTVRAPGYVQGVFKMVQALDDNAPESQMFNRIAEYLGFTIARDEVTGQPEVRVPARAAHLLNQFVAVKNLGKMADFAMGESFDPFGVSSILTGVTAVSNTEEYRTYRNQYEQYQRLQDLLRKLRDEGTPVPTLQGLEEQQQPGTGRGLRRMVGR